MRLSFLPGDLHLSDSATGYILTRGGNEVFRTHSERAAIMRFNRVKDEMERNGVGTAARPAEATPALPDSSAAGVSARRTQRRKPERKRGARSVPRPQVGTSKPPAKGTPRAPAAGHAAASRKLAPACVQQKLSELRAQRDRISRAISALEALDGDGAAGGLRGRPRVAVAAPPQNGRTGAKNLR
jgi:hypothetical protein